MNKNELNNMIIENMINLAAKECLQKEINEFNDVSDMEKHTFSPAFEKKMEKLFKIKPKKLTVKSIMSVTKKVAVVVMIVISLTFAGLMSVKAFRAEVYRIVTEIYEKYIDIFFKSDDESTKSQVNKIEETYLPSYIPDKYERSNLIISFIKVMAEYINSNGNMIFYDQGLISDGGPSIDGENYSIKNIKINDINGSLYIYNEETLDNNRYFIIWYDEKYYYTLSGNIELSELLKMAESLQKEK